MKDLAMQTRCIYCEKEQYGPAVYDISHGEHPCVWCGMTPPPLSQDIWLAVIHGEKPAPEPLEVSEMEE